MAQNGEYKHRSIKSRERSADPVKRKYWEQCHCDSDDHRSHLLFWMREVWCFIISLPCICLELVRIPLATFSCCGHILSKYNKYRKENNEKDWLTLYAGEDILDGVENEGFRPDKSTISNEARSSSKTEPVCIKIERGEHEDMAQMDEGGNRCSLLRGSLTRTCANVAKQYKLTTLHLAVMANDITLGGLTDQQVKTMLKEETTFYFGKALRRGARLPLALAILNGYESIVNKLVTVGARLDDSDIYGYNAIHTVVILAGLDFKMASKMYDFLINLFTVWWKKENPNSRFHKMEAVYYLLNLKTKARKLTPLELAASLGIKDMVAHILNTEYAYKFTVFQTDIQEIAFYDVKDLDQVLNPSKTEPSVVELICTSENDKALECLDIPLIDHFLEQKWNNYFLYYVVKAIAYLVYMSVFTHNIYHQTYFRNSTRNETHESFQEHITPFHFNGIEIFLMIGACFNGIVGITSFASTTKLLVQRQIKYGSFYLLWRRLVLAIYAVVSTSIIFLWIGTKANGLAIQRIFQILVLVFGWTFVILYMHGFRLTAFFSVMVERLLKDVLLFGVCFVFITLGFASAFVVNMRFNGHPPPNYASIEHAYFTLFRMIFGLAEVEELFNREKFTYTTFGINVALFTGYIILTMLLLLNMLIASMSNAYTKIADQKHLFWKKLRAFNIYHTEQRLPFFLQRFSSYYPVKTYNIKGHDGEPIKREVFMFKI